MNDILGDDLLKWKALESKLARVFDHFGYAEIRTPVLEKLEVFSQSVGEETDIVEKQMYTLMDQGSDRLVMRPEGTAAFIRAVIEHQLHRLGHPQRFYYYQPMFRHERPQKGRLRQFHQFGAELILDPTPEADAELLAMLDHLVRSVGISQYELRLNSVGCETCRPIYRDRLKAYFEPHRASLCELCQKRLDRAPMRVLDCKKAECQALIAGAPSILDSLCQDCVTHHDKMKSSLIDCQVKFIEDAGIVRGLDYYRRTAFEVTSNLLGAQSALAGGGRYDGLSERFGEKPFPAVGFAIGAERLLLAMEASGVILASPPEIPVVFIALGAAAAKILLPLSLRLKTQGLRVDMRYESDRSLKSQMKSADRVGAGRVVILGDTEIAEGAVILKDMKTGTQTKLPFQQLEKELLGRVSVES